MFGLVKCLSCKNDFLCVKPYTFGDGVLIITLCVFATIWKSSRFYILGKETFPFPSLPEKFLKNMIYLTSAILFNVILTEKAEEMPVLIRNMFHLILWCDDFNRAT